MRIYGGSPGRDPTPLKRGWGREMKKKKKKKKSQESDISSSISGLDSELATMRGNRWGVRPNKKKGAGETKEKIFGGRLNTRAATTLHNERDYYGGLSSKRMQWTLKETGLRRTCQVFIRKEWVY